LEQKWKELLPNAPFAYEFLDVTLQSLYRTEYRLKKAAQVSSLLSLIIVVIGVLGLVSISLVRRTKEIGIRRVLGAQLVDINWLFMKEFVAVSAISMILAVPFFIFLGERWLENFAYRVPMNYVLIWGLILFFFLLLIGVVFLQAFQKIRMNPSESLRSE
jgi:putative ABC transport system permease protein